MCKNLVWIPLAPAMPRLRKLFARTFPDEIQLKILEHQHLHRRLAGFIGIGLILIFALTVLPPILVGLFRPLDDGYIDFVKWVATVVVAGMGPVFGFYFSEATVEKRLQAVRTNLFEHLPIAGAQGLPPSFMHPSGCF